LLEFPNYQRLELREFLQSKEHLEIGISQNKPSCNLTTYLLTGAVDIPLVRSFKAGLPNTPLLDVKSNTSSTI